MQMEIYSDIPSKSEAKMKHINSKMQKCNRGYKNVHRYNNTHENVQRTMIGFFSLIFVLAQLAVLVESQENSQGDQFFLIFYRMTYESYYS